MDSLRVAEAVIIGFCFGRFRDPGASLNEPKAPRAFWFLSRE